MQNVNLGIFMDKKIKSIFENTQKTNSRIFMAIKIFEFLWPLKFVASPLKFSSNFLLINLARLFRQINSFNKKGV